MSARILIAMLCLAGVALADEPVRRFHGLSAADDAARFAMRASWKVDVAPGGSAFTGKLRLGGSEFALAGVFDSGGVAQFAGGSMLKVKRPGLPKAFLSFARVAGAGGVPRLEGTVAEQGTGVVAHLAAEPALYVAGANPPAPFLQTPLEMRAQYTVVFAAKSPSAQGRTADEFPQGHGFAQLRVKGDGQVTLVGRLAEGSAVSASAPLTRGAVWPFFCVLDGGLGGITGPALFRDRTALSDLDAANVAWFKPPALDTLRYPNGWPDGIRVDMVGSRYVVPAVADHESVFPGLAPTDANGNARLTLAGGGLSAGLVKGVNINARNLASIPNPAADAAGISIDATTGLIRGSFVHGESGAVRSLRGVIFQKQARAFGYFFGP